MTNATEDSMATEITDEMIEQLRTESRGVDDYLMSAICDRALAGEAQAVAECARVIADANAQIDPLYWWADVDHTAWCDSRRGHRCNCRGEQL